MKSLILYYLSIIAMAILLALFVITFTDGVRAASEPGCVPMGEANGEVLYFCESDYGVSCVWDPAPSTGLGAGVMDCGW